MHASCGAMALRAAAAFFLLVIAACGPPAAEDDPTADAMCVEGTVTAVLQVDLDDPRVIWGTQPDTGGTLGLRLAGGYGVTPEDEIVDPDNRVIARTGDTIVSGCRDIIQGAVWISEADIRRAPGT